MKKSQKRCLTLCCCFASICLINKFPQEKIDQIAMQSVSSKENTENNQMAYERLKMLLEHVEAGQFEGGNLLNAYQEIQCICIGSDEVSLAGAALYPPISRVSPEFLPRASRSPSLFPKETAWKKGNQNKLPTNNWLQQLADFPMRKSCCNMTGCYKVSWAPEQGGMLFQTPLQFIYHGDSTNEAHGWIQPLFNEGFLIRCSQVKEPVSIDWEIGKTGNLLRRVQGSLATLHLCQGGRFQVATYEDGQPLIAFLKQNVLQKERQELPNGLVKYRAETNQHIFVVYGHAGLELDWIGETSTWNASKNYTGHIQVASLLKSPQAVTEEKELDTYADRVIVYAQGSLLPEGRVQLLYLCENLQGKETALPPLVVLKPHHVDTLISSTTVEKREGSLKSLYGNLTQYSGSLFSFKLDSNQALTAALPPLANGKPALSKERVEKEILDSGLLKQTLVDTIKENPPKTVYEGGKSLYKIALTLALAERCLDLAQKDKQEIQKSLQPLYKHLCSGLDTILDLFVFDEPWKTLVPKGDDYGAHTQMHDHIVQYGFTLYALTLLKNYEDRYINSKEHFLSRTVKAAGYENYTNQQMGDLIAADIGELSEQGDFIPVRNLDLYNGHCWLSGIGGPSSDGNNIESQSEAVFGAMACAAWLEETQKEPLLVSAAKTRLALEMQGLHRYFHIGEPAQSIYAQVSLPYAEKHPVVSLLWDTKRCAETYWGLQWDRILACELMPAGINLMHNYLTGAPSFSKRIAQYIIDHWQQFDTSNKIQSVLIPIVAAQNPKQARRFIADVAARRSFDIATNAFILTLATLYAEENAVNK